MRKIDEIIAKYNYDNDSFLSIELMMRDYAEWYAKKCLEEADSLYDWDHDMELWTGDYKPSEIDLPSHEDKI